MINMIELKPIIEPLLTEENAAEVISKISEIDREPENQDVPDVSEEVKKAIDANNKEWNERFKSTFFSGSTQPQTQTKEETDTQTDKQTETKKPTTYEELFKVE